MLWHVNERGKNKSNEKFKKRIPSTKYDRPKQLENVEYFKHLGSMLTNGGRCICEIKSRIAMAKAHSTRSGLFLLARWT